MTTLWCTDVPFTTSELQTLRTQGFALVADRIVHSAQPPMSVEDFARVEELIGAPVPDQLAELWRFTAGGRLDYELWIPRDGVVEQISFTDLFHIGADTYLDLLGWLADQREFTAEEVQELGIDWDGALPGVPFGGFEYLDRLFVDRADGQVVVWREATPGWTSGPHERTQARLAPDLPAAFRLLFLADDPRSPTRKYASGDELLREIDEAPLSEDLRARLTAYACRALLDWRADMADAEASGALMAPVPFLVAAMHARSTDDGALAARLAVLAGPGTDSDGILRDALAHEAYEVAQAYARAGWWVPPESLTWLGEGATPEVVTTLVECGARADAEDLATMASNCGIELAELAQRLDGTVEDRRARAAALVHLDELEELLASARHNNPHGTHGPLRARIERTRAYAKRKGGLWPWRR